MARSPANRSGLAAPILLAVALGLIPRPATACSCMPPPAPDESFDSADAVFLAEVMAIDRPPVYPAWYYQLLIAIDDRFDTDFSWQVNDLTAQLEVEASWKGVPTTRTAVRTGAGGGDCGYPFVVGHRYLIYAYRYAGSLSTGICSRTAAQAHAVEDIDFLAGQGPLALTRVTPMPRRLLLGSVLIAAGCVAVGLRLLGRKRA